MTLREQRLILQREIDVIKAMEVKIKVHIIDTLPKSQATGVAGKRARVSVVTREEPRIVDREAFRRYINRTRRFDLAYALRPSPPAIRELWEEGEDVPGVEKYHNVTVSIGRV